MVSRVADILAEQPEHADARGPGLRSMAFGGSPDPAELLRLAEHGPRARRTLTPSPSQPDPDVEPDLPRALAVPADLLGALGRIDPDRPWPRAVTSYGHLHGAAVTGAEPRQAQDGARAGVMARVEGLGPHA